VDCRDIAAVVAMTTLSVSATIIVLAALLLSDVITPSVLARRKMMCLSFIAVTSARGCCDHASLLVGWLLRSFVAFTENTNVHN